MIIGRKVIVKDEVASTNDVAKSLAAEGEEEGVVVTARTQVAGRGRLGRRWSSPEGGLYLSVILRPKLQYQELFKLSVLSCLPVAEAIEEMTGLDVRIKWPNDVEVDGRKVAGILLETASKGDEVAFAVLGIGVNLNIEPGHIEAPNAASLSALSGRGVDREAFLNLLLYKLDSFYQAVLKGGFDMNGYHRRSSTIGADIVAEIDGREIRGKGTAVESSGALVMTGDDGQIFRLTAVHDTSIRSTKR